VHSLSGGALISFSRKFGPEKNFRRPGGARTPSAPPVYAYADDFLNLMDNFA